MAQVAHNLPGAIEHRGVLYASKMCADVLDNIHTLEFKTSDVLICAYVRTGITLVEELVWLIQNNLDYVTAAQRHLRDRVKTVEINATEFAGGNKMKLKDSDSNRVMASYLYRDYFPQLCEATAKGLAQPKVILLTRDVRDTAVSIYYYYKMCTFTGCFTGSWEEFYAMFEGKKLLLGDWYEYYRGWMKFSENNSNVYIVRYEDLTTRPEEEIVKMADFLGKELSYKEVRKLRDHVSFESMKNNPMTNMRDRPFYNQNISSFLRCGRVQQWKPYFTKQQAAEALRNMHHVGVHYQ